jgi:hypothetical protein
MSQNPRMILPTGVTSYISKFIHSQYFKLIHTIAQTLLYYLSRTNGRSGRGVLLYLGLLTSSSVPPGCRDPTYSNFLPAVERSVRHRPTVKSAYKNMLHHQIILYTRIIRCSLDKPKLLPRKERSVNASTILIQLQVRSKGSQAGSIIVSIL